MQHDYTRPTALGRDEEEPPPLPCRLSVGITYNLKEQRVDLVEDEQAEYDSIDTVHAIEAALEAYGCDVRLFPATSTLPEQLISTPVDIVFNIAEGRTGRGREAEVPALLNLLGIPFTGSDETTLCLALDKALTKRLLASYHVRTPRYRVVSPAAPAALAGISYPVIVKPNAEGSSKGISDVSIAAGRVELAGILREKLALYRQDMLVEEFIEGREFTVGLLGNGASLQVFRPMEIHCRPTQGGYSVYSYNVKKNYQELVRYECPAALTPALEAEMTAAARKIYGILGCKDFARIDFRLSAADKLYFLEINPLPGMAPGYSDYPMIAEFNGISHTELVQRILRAALERQGIGR